MMLGSPQTGTRREHYAWCLLSPSLRDLPSPLQQPCREFYQEGEGSEVRDLSPGAKSPAKAKPSSSTTPRCLPQAAPG